MLNAGDFARRLSETIAWCSNRVDISNPQWCLRSAELRPEAANTDDAPAFWNSPEAIGGVIEQRSRLVNLQPLQLHNGINGGRLLLCFFDWTNHNECTAVESNWFFDGNDNPPWDTWVGSIGDALVAWIPSEFHAVVDDAISVEAVGMLMWLENPIIGYSIDRTDLQKLPHWLYDYSVQPYQERY